MPIRKVPTEEFLIVEVPTEKFPRNKTAAANITAPAVNTITTHIVVPAASIIIPTTHVIAPAASIIARDTPYLKKQSVSRTYFTRNPPLHARDTRYFCKKGVSQTETHTLN